LTNGPYEGAATTDNRHACMDAIIASSVYFDLVAQIARVMCDDAGSNVVNVRVLHRYLRQVCQLAVLRQLLL
jgi:hypothetical protein